MDNSFIAFDIRNAIKKLGELTGEIYSKDILYNIFSKFCIGK
jgi:tRNA U34 5-carboxymethylaminomethyl modifying GTPase MnmE/TrmE